MWQLRPTSINNTLIQYHLNQRDSLSSMTPSIWIEKCCWSCTSYPVEIQLAFEFFFRWSRFRLPERTLACPTRSEIDMFLGCHVVNHRKKSMALRIMLLSSRKFQLLSSWAIHPPLRLSICTLSHYWSWSELAMNTIAIYLFNTLRYLRTCWVEVFNKNRRGLARTTWLEMIKPIQGC